MVIHLCPSRAEDKLQVVPNDPKQAYVLQGQQAVVRARRSPEERARIRQIGRVLGSCRGALEKAQKSPGSVAECDVEATWGAGVERVRFATNMWASDFNIRRRISGSHCNMPWDDPVQKVPKELLIQVTRSGLDVVGADAVGVDWSKIGRSPPPCFKGKNNLLASS